MADALSFRAGTLNIASGATESEEVNMSGAGGCAKQLNIWCPGTPTGTIQIYVAPAIGGSYLPLDNGVGGVVSLVAAHANSMAPLLCGALKLHSTGTEGGARTFPYIGDRAQK